MSKKPNIGDFDFAQHLKNITKDYKGKYSKSLIYTSPIFSLCCEMVYSRKIGRKERNMLYKTVAYFILPRDVYSESVYGVKGFIDDLMLCLYVLNIIADRHGYDILYDRWNGKPNQLKNLLNKDYHSIIKENKKMFEKVLKEVDIDLV